jgi:hypothetical protein
MSFLRRLSFLSALLVALAVEAVPARAVIVMTGRDVNGNLDNSGTNKNPAPFGLGDYEGHFGGFLGTPIAPTYFITARHIGNAGGGVFTFNNGTTTTTTYTVADAGEVGNTDLEIWKVTAGGTFSHFAPLYASGNEIGNALVAIGNGTTRGGAVTSPAPFNQFSGWAWGGAATAASWGTATVVATPTAGQVGAPAGFGGDFLQFAFNRVTDVSGNVLNPDQGIFSTGDSGGGTFVRDPSDGVYKLAGVNSLVDQVLDSSGNPLSDALFDSRGFYTTDPNNNLIQITGNSPVPLNSYSTRISSNLAEIRVE